MADSIKVAEKQDIPRGSMKVVEVVGKKIVIANIDGNYFAMDDECTHNKCSLGNMGFLKGSVLTCGCHGGQFDLTSGKALKIPAIQNEKTYPITIKGQDLYVSL